MTNKEVIYKAVRFIEDNLKNEIDVFAVSQEVCYSLYHFIRLFQHITGFSPKSYVQKRRLTEAVNELRNTDKKIADIAYDFQFGSPETFSRAFKKQFNTSPIKVRNEATTKNLPIVFPITYDSIFQPEKIKHNPPEILELSEILLVGTSFFASENSYPKDLSKQWAQFMSEQHIIQEKITPERNYQVQYWSENQELDGLYFFIGTEVDKISQINPFFVVKTIPKGKYLRFIHKGFSNSVEHTYKYIYNQYLPDTEYKLNRPFNFELYGDKFKGAFNEQSESEIYIPINSE